MKSMSLILSIAISFQVNAFNRKMALQKAIDTKIIKAKALSNGGYQDYCMNLNLHNLSEDSLIVVVEAGRRLNSIDENNQDILIVREEIIVLKRHENKWVPVKGFCCQAKNHSPSKNAQYDINRLADSNLVQVARFLSTRNFDSHVTQQAIWSISDNNPSATISSSKNDSINFELRRLVANLKNEPIPWYTIITKTMVYPNGRMEHFNLALKGKMEFNNEKECYTTLHVLNAKGDEVCKIVRQWSLNGKNVYDLDLPLAGLQKGKYTIELNAPDKNLVKREFEL